MWTCKNSGQILGVDRKIIRRKNMETFKKVGLGLIFVVLLSSVFFLFRAKNTSLYAEDSRIVIEGILMTEKSEISPKLSGKIEKILKKEGDIVNEGDVLFTLETKELLAKKKQAEAGIRASENDLEKAKTAYQFEIEKTEENIKMAEDGVKVAQSDVKNAKTKVNMIKSGARKQEIAQLECAVKASESTFNTAELTYKRIKNLADDGVIAEQKADEAKMAYENAKNAYEANKQKLSLAREGARKEEIAMAEELINKAETGVEVAQQKLELAKSAKKSVDIAKITVDNAQEKLNASKATLEEIEAYLENSVVKSPISGRISNVYSKKGEIISAGYSVMSIAEVDNYWTEVYIDENILANHKIGDKVSVEVPAMGKTYTGKITSLNSTGDFATKRSSTERGSYDIKSVKARIDFEEKIIGIADGLTARVILQN